MVCSHCVCHGVCLNSHETWTFVALEHCRDLFGVLAWCSMNAGRERVLMVYLVISSCFAQKDTLTMDESGCTFFAECERYIANSNKGLRPRNPTPRSSRT